MANPKDIEMRVYRLDRRDHTKLSTYVTTDKNEIRNLDEERSGGMPDYGSLRHKPRWGPKPERNYVLADITKAKEIAIQLGAITSGVEGTSERVILLGHEITAIPHPDLNWARGFISSHKEYPRITGIKIINLQEYIDFLDQHKAPFEQYNQKIDEIREKARKAEEIAEAEYKRRLQLIERARKEELKTLGSNPSLDQLILREFF